MALEAVTGYSGYQAGHKLVPVWLLYLALLGWSAGGTTGAAETPSSAILASGCTGCHGTDGVSQGAALPSIAGIDRRYLMRVMLEFKQGERPATIMDRIAQGYSDNELRRIAIWFSGQPWRSTDPPTNSDAMTEGERLHQQGCEECHEQRGRFQDRDVPRIAGQGADYLLLQLEVYQNPREKQRQPEKMQQALAQLSGQQLQLLARYYASQR